MPTRDLFSSISRRAILAVGVAVLLVLVVATATVLALLRRDALNTAEWHLGNLATALSEQSWQSVHAIELVCKTTADELKDHFAGRHRLSEQEMAVRLGERVRSLPNAEMIAFVDASGRAVVHDPVPAASELNFADREHFRVHLERRIDGLFIGRPVVGRVLRDWLDVFSWRVEDDHGVFRGAVTVAVATNYFQRLFAAIDLGEDGQVFLLRDDGVLLASHPSMERLYGASFAERLRSPFGGKDAPFGVERRADLIDQEPRIVAYWRLQGYPLMVAVSATERFFLEQWRRDAWRIGIGAGGVALFIAGALFFMLRQRRVSAALEHQLQETGVRLHGIMQSAMDAIVTVDVRQRVVLFNAAAEKIFRCPAAEAVGGPLERFIPERFRAAHREHIANFGRTGAATRMMGARLALYGLRADGEEFPIDASISQVAMDGDRYFTVILRDITERKQSEQALERSYVELRELSAAMNEVREAERTRIARELHDELAQWLTALKMDVSWVASRLPHDLPQLAEKAEKMKRIVDTTVASVRRIAADLRPVMLDDLGLVPAIEGLLHQLSERSDIVVGLDADAEALDYGEPLATSVYRMVQEALTNVARHAEAREVRVTMGIEGEHLVVRVRDDGKGFDAEAAALRKSYGIIGIRERAQTLGGSARVSRLERGTLVEIAIPVARYRKRGRVA